MQIIIKQFLSKFLRRFSTHYLKDDDSFSLKKFIVDDNPYQKYGLAAAGGTVVSFASILEVTVTFKLVNAYNNSIGAYNTTSKGAFLSAELIGVNDNNGEVVNGTTFHLDNASYLIDSWWCEVLVAVGVAAAIAAWCFATDGECLAQMIDEEKVVSQAEKMTEAVVTVVDYFGEDWGANTYDGIYNMIYASKGVSLGSMIKKVIDYICDL